MAAFVAARIWGRVATTLPTTRDDPPRCNRTATRKKHEQRCRREGMSCLALRRELYKMHGRTSPAQVRCFTAPTARRRHGERQLSRSRRLTRPALDELQRASCDSPRSPSARHRSPGRRRDRSLAMGARTRLARPAPKRLYSSSSCAASPWPPATRRRRGCAQLACSALQRDGRRGRAGLAATIA